MSESVTHLNVGGVPDFKLACGSEGAMSDRWVFVLSPGMSTGSEWHHDESKVTCVECRETDAFRVRLRRANL